MTTLANRRRNPGAPNAYETETAGALVLLGGYLAAIVAAAVVVGVVAYAVVRVTGACS